MTKERDSIYAKGPERLFVFVQALLPRLVDRAIAAQMADKRVQDYFDQRYEAARARAGGRQPDQEPLRKARGANPIEVTRASPGRNRVTSGGIDMEVMS